MLWRSIHPKNQMSIIIPSMLDLPLLHLSTWFHLHSLNSEVYKYKYMYIIFWRVKNILLLDKLAVKYDGKCILSHLFLEYASWGIFLMLINKVVQLPTIWTPHVVFVPHLYIINNHSQVKWFAYINQDQATWFENQMLLYIHKLYHLFVACLFILFLPFSYCDVSCYCITCYKFPFF